MVKLRMRKNSKNLVKESREIFHVPIMQSNSAK